MKDRLDHVKQETIDASWWGAHHHVTSKTAFRMGSEFGVQTYLALTEQEWKQKREDLAWVLYAATGSPLFWGAIGKPQKQHYRKLADATLGHLGFRIEEPVDE